MASKCIIFKPDKTIKIKYFGIFIAAKNSQ